MSGPNSASRLSNRLPQTHATMFLRHRHGAACSGEEQREIASGPRGEVKGRKRHEVRSSAVDVSIPAKPFSPCAWSPIAWSSSRRSRRAGDGQSRTTRRATAICTGTCLEGAAATLRTLESGIAAALCGS